MYSEDHFKDTTSIETAPLKGDYERALQVNEGFAEVATRSQKQNKHASQFENTSSMFRESFPGLPGVATRGGPMDCNSNSVALALW